ncbi:hypothetical protein pb186bvf_005911 [Paramecium bursaria]
MNQNTITIKMCCLNYSTNEIKIIPNYAKLCQIILNQDKFNSRYCQLGLIKAKEIKFLETLIGIKAKQLLKNIAKTIKLQSIFKSKENLIRNLQYGFSSNNLAKNTIFHGLRISPPYDLL